ncbi:glucan phosphoethanolaminetransferase (alkaline phosphatase superfamily) [Algoriphagus iocasae]|uniref:Glucan phosphoethanolaminetransferase (Alkaline phosphatase superfamily) n=1 Tax=Algoriphagus iocasae TaxID=1836499 RepID=A0A841N1V7_9BACT|nr:DUF4293 domain-containing protein [Algoriphagus iocasae]MBB6328645.1 glucan phosphoethanolaminetransferase (alkaline phosphatase superfamily) [Algoriphagus iocasae]
MIQRVQSIFLFLVAAAMGVTLGMDLWHQVIADSGESFTLTALFLEKYDNSGEVILSESKWYIAALASFVGFLAIISIFQYRNRGRQMMLNMVNSLLMVGLVATIFLTTNGINSELGANDNGQYQIGFWAVLAAMVCNMLANRFIRKDEALVRSVDRIR